MGFSGYFLPILIFVLLNIVGFVLVIGLSDVSKIIFIIVWTVVVLGIIFRWKSYTNIIERVLFSRPWLFIFLSLTGLILFLFFSLAYAFGMLDNKIFPIQNYFGGAEVVWSRYSDNIPFLAFKGDTLYAWNSNNGILTTIDKNSGKIINSENTNTEQSILTRDFYNDTYFVLRKSGNLNAIDISNWQEKWSFQIEDFEYVSGGTNITSFDGTIYVSIGADRVEAFNYETGSRLWNYEIDLPRGNTNYYKSPIIAAENNIVFIGFIDGSIHAVDAVSGNKIWEITPSGSWLSYSLFASSGLIYIAPYNGVNSYQDFNSTYVFDSKTGREMYQVPGAAIKVSGETLYVIYENLLRAIDKNGKVIWQRGIPYYELTNIEEEDGVLYYGSFQDPIIEPRRTEFYAVDPQSGNTIWKYKISGSIKNGFEVNDGIVYLFKRTHGGTALEMIALQKK